MDTSMLMEIYCLVKTQGTQIMAKVADLKLLITTLKDTLAQEKEEIFGKIKELEDLIVDNDNIPDDVVVELQGVISDIEGIIVQPIPEEPAPPAPEPVEEPVEEEEVIEV